MDYKEQAELNKALAAKWNKCSCIYKIGGMKPKEFLLLNATAITDLLARAEAAEARAEKAEKCIEWIVKETDCPPEVCREICANHDGVCAEHAKIGHYDHCKGFKWIGEKEE